MSYSFIVFKTSYKLPLGLREREEIKACVLLSFQTGILVNLFFEQEIEVPRQGVKVAWPEENRSLVLA